jgi:hypothetical protein
MRECPHSLVPMRALAFLLALAVTACAGSSDEDGAATCCKICSDGKACGDSCIEATKTCEAGPGCACNAAPE